MTEEIKFHTVDVGFDIFDDLRKKRLINNTTLSILKAVQSRGGYVAGGFGSILARRYLLNKFDRENGEEFYDIVRNHLGHPVPRDGSKWQNAGCGDIDVWFPTDTAVNLFMNLSNSFVDVSKTQTVTSAAIEFIVESDSRIQVITRWTRPINEQLAGFDIYNAMVAVRESKITVPEHWEQLESKDVLHVSNWNSQWTMNRLFKWIGRKHWYVSVTPPTAEYVYDRLVEIISWKKSMWSNIDQHDDQIIDYLSRDRLKKRVIVQDAYHMHKFLKRIIPSLTNEQLLMISSLFPDVSKYDLSMKEIYHRASLHSM